MNQLTTFQLTSQFHSGLSLTLNTKHVSDTCAIVTVNLYTIHLILVSFKT
jgi:hypothetical protein